MQRFVLLALVALLAACGLPRQAPPPDWRVTYYDRNGDGIVDYEFHMHTRRVDANWALIDTTFQGHYNRRLFFGHEAEQRVYIVVPKGVKITAGNPPRSYTY
ncbi:MAG TPA: hypothetical protein VJ063_09305 [Verrucomicrobiae bacterium]|nr:hypothetical protein [Verrucomicrobiae bacterium]